LLLAVVTGFAIVPRISRAQSAAEPDEIRIVVSGVPSQEGLVICSIWASTNERDFLKPGTALHRISVAIQKNGDAVCEFKSLRADTYAATAFHDKNRDNKLNRNAIGMPLEAYGFTNNVKPKFRKPSFKQCAFQFDGKGVSTFPISLIDPNL
jgi:uncharacterized protein (DUF2141 family)